MKKIYSSISTAVFCYIFWILYTITSSPEGYFQELLLGAVVCLIIGFFSGKFFIKENPFWLFNPKRLVILLMFIPVYTIELIKANIDVAKRALSPKLNINPGIIKIETDVKSDYGLSMLSNCITLTPGTITMDIVEDRGKNYMYIHWIDVQETSVKEASKIIKGAFEPWVGRIFK